MPNDRPPVSALDDEERRKWEYDDASRPPVPTECGYECPYTEEGHQAHDLDHSFKARPPVSGETRTPLAIIRDWDTGDHNAHNCPGAYEPCDGAHVIIEQIERASKGAALDAEDWARIVHAEFHGGDFDTCLRPEADRATARSLLNRAARLAETRT